MSNSTEPIRTDVAVVGAGIAGLTAAELLRRAGRDVLVIDGAEAGGRGRSDMRAGARVNRGPHALYLGGDAERVLTSLDVALTGGPPSAGGAALSGGRTGDLPFGPVSLLRTTLLGARGKVAAASLLRRLGRLDASSLGEVSFGAWLTDQDLPADAAAMVAMLARVSTYANAPDIAASDMVLGMMQRAMSSGVRYLHGGWQSIIDTLASRSTILAAPATAVHSDGGTVVVECGPGRNVVASAAVVAVGTPTATAALLGCGAFDVGPAAEAACLDLVCSQPAEPGLLLGMDEPLYLSDHSVSAHLAPAGRHVVHVARYLAPGEHRDPAATRAELEQHAAAAGLDERTVVDARYLHRMTAVGALAVARNGGLSGRPRVSDSGLAGVYLSGDWVGRRGHLLDAVVASAEEAALRIVQRSSADRLVTR